MATAVQPRIHEVPDDLLAAIDWCYEQGWTDGLPVVPPVVERVKAMLAADARPPETVISTHPATGLDLSLHAAAVNAVMAGCLPEYFPVVVAAFEAMDRPEFNFHGSTASTGGSAPLLVVSGPYADEIGMNADVNLFGPGNRANATTGRALRLVLLHIAGAVPGPGDASTQGGPAKYSYCVAENLAGTPWQGYAASVGVDAPSAVTVHCGEAPHNVHDMESDSPAPILDKIASAMATLGPNNVPISQGEFFIALCPEHAATIAKDGWARRDIQSYLFQRARIRAGRVHQAFASLAWDPWMRGVPDDDLLPMTSHPDNIRVFVCGGAGKHSSVIPSWGMTKSVTLPVEP